MTSQPSEPAEVRAHMSEAMKWLTTAKTQLKYVLDTPLDSTNTRAIVMIASEYLLDAEAALAAAVARTPDAMRLCLYCAEGTVHHADEGDELELVIVSPSECRHTHHDEEVDDLIAEHGVHVGHTPADLAAQAQQPGSVGEAVNAALGCDHSGRERINRQSYWCPDCGAISSPTPDGLTWRITTMAPRVRAALAQEAQASGAQEANDGDS